MGNNKKQRMRRRRRGILFGIELLVILVLAGGLFVLAKLDKKLNQVTQVPVDLGNVEVNPGANEEVHLSGYRTIAVAGIDSRKTSDSSENSDSTMIVTLDNDNKTIRVVSLYRDTYLNVGKGRYNKCNDAYNLGGAEQFMSMLNQNMDLNITEFVTVDFAVLSEVIDTLGGIDMHLTADEVVMMNDYCVGTSEVTGTDYTRIEPQVEGDYHLSGVQAVSYMRIRYGQGLEFRRTVRQRAVLYKLLEQMKAADLGTLYSLLDVVLPDVATNISKSDIVNLGLAVRGYSIEDTKGFPFDHMWGSVVEERMDGLDCIVPVTLKTNVEKLHAFLYPNLAYTPTETLVEISDHISEESGYTEEDIPTTSEDGGEMPS